MDYKTTYNSLINRAKSRIIEGYTEKHHIVPKCLGGSNDDVNIVSLTAREHYVAHQLLIKIHPNNYKLVYAAMMMCVSSQNQNRLSNNRYYSWIKIRYSMEVSLNQTGIGNSQYGTRWIHNLTKKISKKISKNDLLPEGYTEGRKVKWDGIKRYRKKEEVRRLCVNCNEEIITARSRQKYCSKCNTIQHPTQMLNGREDEFIKLYKKYNLSANKALKSMGTPGNVAGYYTWAKKVIDSLT